MNQTHLLVSGESDSATLIMSLRAIEVSSIDTNERTGNSAHEGIAMEGERVACGQIGQGIRFHSRAEGRNRTGRLASC